jgi:glycosyltransferase involved in cell wall biosynthesis
MHEAVKSLSVVIPAFNEEANIGKVVAAALRVLPSRVPDFEVIVVDDGSADLTSAVVRRYVDAKQPVRLITHATNISYGGALRSGFTAATKGWIFFTDGDNQFDLAEIDRLLAAAKDRTLVTGYRLVRRDPLPRRLNAWAYSRLFVPLLFGIRLRDVNCAFKLFPRALVEAFPLAADGALINAELYARAAQLGLPLVEVPVNHYPRTAGAQTGGSIKVVLKACLGLYRLRRRIGNAKPRPSREGRGSLNAV